MDRDVIREQFFEKDILAARQFSRAGMHELFIFAERMRNISRRIARSQILGGYIMGSFFFGDSTRTRISSEVAFLRLGGGVVTFTDMQYSSMSKGESFEDTIFTLDLMCNIMALRLKTAGQAAIAAKVANNPVINCGDGYGEHPTQGLLDVFTFQEGAAFDITNNPYTIALVGDLKYGRTVHSLVPMLTTFCDDVRFRFVAPDFLQLPDDVVSQSDNSIANAVRTDDFESGIAGVDAIYMVRPQLKQMKTDAERDSWHEIESQYRLNRSVFEKCCKPDTLITHPGPRNAELDTDLDELPNAAYRRRQPENGVAIRMALSVFILGKEDKFV